jgi:GNAT superfamily N-acetyltransferase
MIASSIRSFRPDDLPRAAALFAAYPYKEPQRVAQRLDRDRLNAFYLEGLRRAVEAGRPHWVAEAGGEFHALAGLTADSWQSGVYGMKMGKIQPWIADCGLRIADCGSQSPNPNPQSSIVNRQSAISHPQSAIRNPQSAGAVLLATVENGARAEGFEQLAARLDGADFPNLHTFEAAGWRLVDVSLKFTLPMPNVGGRAAPPARAARWTIDLAAAGDGDWIRTLAAQSHGATHYLNDPTLPAAATHELFARWVARCLEGLAYHVYTLRDEDGAGRGFVTYLKNEGFARAVGRAPLILDFVLIDPAVRGGGLGPWLIEETLAREEGGGFDYCELRTSAHNLPAVMAYEKLGFRCCASDFTMHKRL